VKLWPVKVSSTAERKFAGEEREIEGWVGFPEMETPKSQLAIYSSPFTNFRKP
jgi:hypothetical protein